MDEPLQPVRVWDLPTRLVHWTLAVCVIALVVTARIGGDLMAWHFRLGYTVFTLLLFRLLWGFVGGHWSRFVRFVYGPASLLRYLRGQAQPDDHFEVGHNPLGAFSVFGLLAILGVQVATGLVADDEISSTGPLIKFVSGALSSKATSWHKAYGQWIIITLVVLHIAAILFYLLRKRRNLIHPMLSGDKALGVHVPSSSDGAAQRLVALLLFALCAGGVAWVVSLGG
jgi:cytochrome b